MIFGFSAESVALLANLVTIVGFPIAAIGLFAVGRQMRNDRLAVSAGAIGALRSGILARIERLQAAGEREDDLKAWREEFFEFANDLEMACAIYLDGQMSGRTGRLAEAMLFDFLKMVNDDAELKAELIAAIHSHDTFRNILDFWARMKRKYFDLGELAPVDPAI